MFQISRVSDRSARAREFCIGAKGSARKAAGTLLVVGLLLGFRGLAWAEDVEKARELNELAISAYKSEKFLEAIDLWLQACEYANAEQLVKLHKNLGLALHKLGREPEAWYHLTLYMKESPGTDAKVAATVAELEKSLRKLHIKIRVDSQPTGATVYLPPGDRMHMLKTPFSWWLPPGEYGVELKLKGYKDSKETLRVSLDGPESFTFTMEELPRTGTLKLVGKEEGSSVRINGKVQGPIPYEADLPPGKYKVEVHYSSGELWSEEVEVKAGETTEREVVFSIVRKPAEGGRERAVPIWKWISLGTGVVLLGAGGVCTALASNGLDEYDNVNNKYRYIKSSADPDYEGKYLPAYNAVWGDHVEPYLNASYILYGLGGAVVIGSVVAILVTDDRLPASTTLGFFPSVTPDSASATFSVTF